MEDRSGVAKEGRRRKLCSNDPVSQARNAVILSTHREFDALEPFDVLPSNVLYKAVLDVFLIYLLMFQSSCLRDRILYES